MSASSSTSAAGENPAATVATGESSPCGKPVSARPSRGKTGLRQAVSGKPASGKPVSDKSFSGESALDKPASGEPALDKSASGDPARRDAVRRDAVRRDSGRNEARPRGAGRRERRRRAPPRFNGVLLINKTAGCTSHDVVQKIRRALRQREVGHAGSLDPAAEGLLLILLGKAAKLSQYFLNNDKMYTLKMKFGLETDTLDKDGKILKEQAVSLDPATVEKALKEAQGDISLPVPYFSAVKVKGKRLYAYAREGKAVDLPIRVMSFYGLKILEITPDSASVSVSCKKGGYMRSWVHFIGEKTGAGACLVGLTRDGSHPFHLSDSVTEEEFSRRAEESLPADEADLKGLFPASFLSLSESLAHYSAFELTQRDARLLSQGRVPGFLIQKSLDWQAEVNRSGESRIFQAVKNGRLLAIMEIRPFQKLKILKNFSEGTDSS